MCPHCFNSFTKYYPPLGGSFKVVSHVHMINNLIKVGRLKLRERREKIAYHDPCYLGRHNKIFGAPREIVDRIGEVVELPRNRTNSFCCGAGGGNYWNDETGKRINYVRAQEAFEIGAQKIASACPFCVLMLTDGFKMYSDKEVVFDIAELIEQNIESDV
jgi:Fe-S oxidoreductase